ncbi:MAG: thiamine-phosphate kinase [Chloroflexota bacterium]|nr:thiamine-phosphate kinase [Chloroflexota bacterium]
MKVSELGEFGLIQRLTRLLKQRGVDSSPQLALGIGDDAAAWEAQGRLQLGTTDTLVEGVHFIRGQATWRELGWKALAVNISDIAAMGGQPHYALVTLGLPPDTEVEDMDELYEGMAEIARTFGVVVAGGDLVRAPMVIISLALMGSASGELLTRSAGRPGDSVAVTGVLGGAGAGLRMLSPSTGSFDKLRTASGHRQGLSMDQETTLSLRKAFLQPVPRVEEGKALVGLGVRAAIDISDGLLNDLTNLCEASGLEARVEAGRVPVNPNAQKAFGDEALGLALSGGEDYELIFTAPPPLMARAVQTLKTPVTVIGQLVPGTPGKVTLVDERGKSIGRREGGWDHFTSNSPATAQRRPGR